MSGFSSCIRNFVVISHVDHGKSTLADRFLELTGTVEKRKMREQFLDQMELEREKGITIKMQPVRMIWHPHHAESLSSKSESLNPEEKPSASYGAGKSKFQNPKDLEIRDSRLEITSSEFILNLIDTPGHVDFTYEVSRALAAVEGAILLVDGTQGIQAQTIANLNLARKENLEIIPVINKIDSPSCRIRETKEEITKLLDCAENDIFLVSAKTGEGVGQLLDAVVGKIPSPTKRGSADKPFRALIFDSQFDAYKGAIAHVRVVDGVLRAGERLKLVQSGAEFEAMEIGIFRPELSKEEELSAGEIGYVASGLKELQQIRVGDTITKSKIKNQISKIAEELTGTEPIPGYREPKPVVFASVYPESSDDYEQFRDALRKLKLNDASLFFEPESSEALGRGFRMGFLGMLHLEITGERLRREYGLALIFSAPSVSYKIKLEKDEERIAYSAAKFPENHKVIAIQEPWVRLDIISEEKHLGAIIRLLKEIRGAYLKTDYLGGGRVEITYEAPLKEIIVDFYDRLKSVTQGYGSMSYDILGYRPEDLVKLEVFIAGEEHGEFAVIVHRANAHQEGRRLAARLKELIPRQLFSVPIQVATGGRIIARENLPALKKDVTGYLYGGDRTRKMKLWQKQKRGKERLLKTGRVQIPPEVLLQLLKKE